MRRWSSQKYWSVPVAGADVALSRAVERVREALAKYIAEAEQCP